MAATTGMNKKPKQISNNQLEGLRESYTNKRKSESQSPHSESVLQGTVDSFKNMGSEVFRQLFGGGQDSETSSSERFYSPETSVERKGSKVPLRSSGESHNIFSWREQEERKEINQLKELIEAIKQEVSLIKKQDSSLMSDVKDIENITLQSLPSKPGVYHIRFLEVLLNFLKSLRAKIGESQTWMQALMSKKKKRGSAFKKLSKEQGTQYSMSQEFSVRNSVQ
jgi:hypothetical protein